MITPTSAPNTPLATTGTPALGVGSEAAAGIAQMQQMQADSRATAMASMAFSQATGRDSMMINAAKSLKDVMASAGR